MSDERLSKMSERQLRTAFGIACRDFRRFAEGLNFPAASTAMTNINLVLDEYNDRQRA